MKLNDIVADEKHGNGLLGLLIFLLVVGVTVGSVYLAKNSGDMAEGIKNYIGSFCTAVSENKNSMTVFKNSLQANLISVGIVFLMGFLRFGFIQKISVLSLIYCAYLLILFTPPIFFGIII